MHLLSVMEELWGLTEYPAAQRRRMVSGSEMARLIAEFESTSDTRKADHKHHEQNKHTQVAFARDVCSLIKVMGEMGNPFCDDRKDLMVLDSRPGRPSFYKHCSQIQKLGEEHQDSYVKERPDKAHHQPN